MRDLSELIEMLSGAVECLNRSTNINSFNESSFLTAKDNKSLIHYECFSCPNCDYEISNSRINSENSCKQCGLSFLIFQCNWCTALLISLSQNTVVCSNCHHSLDIRVCRYCKATNYYIGQSQICSSCCLEIHDMNPGQISLYYILVLQIIILRQLESEYNYKRSVFFKEFSRLFADEKYVKNKIERYWHEFPTCDENSPYIDMLAKHLEREDVIIALHQILKIVACESIISTQVIKLIRSVFDRLGLNQSEISYFISEYFFVYGIDDYKEFNIPSELMRYFLIMDIKADSTFDDVKKRYRELAMKFHPDRNIGKSEDEIRANSVRFRSVQEAYNVLTKYLS